MDTSRYRAFVKAVDEGTLSAAAQALAYTPSGVSQLISALERDLGFTVLERSSHGVTPTTTGEVILPIARAIIQEEDRLMQVRSDLKGLATGSVTIGSYPSVATHWLPHVIAQFREAYPAIEIRIMEGIHQEIVEWLDNKEVDLGLMTRKENSHYDWIPLAPDPMIAILPADHPMANRKTYPVKNCENEDFIMPGKGQDVDTLEVLSRNNLHPTIAYKTIETMATLGLIEAGMGMTIINSLATRKFDFNVAKIPIDPPQSIMFGFAALNMDALSPAAQRFLEMATQELKKNA